MIDFRLRMWPIGGHAERVALEDDVIPLRFPIKDEAGEELNSIRIKKGQVSFSHFECYANLLSSLLSRSFMFLTSQLTATRICGVPMDMFLTPAVGLNLRDFPLSPGQQAVLMVTSPSSKVLDCARVIVLVSSSTYTTATSR